MEPITFTAIVAWISIGIATGATQAVGEDAYQQLKAVLKRKFGDDSDIVEAVDKLEKKPDSEARKELLREEAEIAGVWTGIQRCVR
jgi:disulfide oxidoreductase YuzD